MKVSTYITPLTGIRAIAAYCVFFYHCNAPLFKNSIFDFQKELHIGVPIFFVLSGFLIALRYGEMSLLNASEFRTYFQNRFARIFPLYFVLVIPTFFYFHIDDITTIIMNITLLKGFYPAYFSTGITQAWSLTVEFCFYFTAPLAFYILNRYKSFTLLVALFSIGSIVVYYTFNHSPFVPILKGTVLEGFLEGRTHYLVFTYGGRFFEFFVGIQLARLVKSRISTPPQKGYLYTLLGIGGIILVLFLLRLICAPDEIGLLKPAGTAINNLVLPFAIATLYFGLITENSIVSKILSSKLFDLLGKSSYAFYLVHDSFIINAMGLVDLYIFKVLYFRFFAAIVVSILLYKLVEAPLNNLLKRSS